MRLSEASRNPSSAESAAVLEARGLTRHFRVGGLFSRKTLHAVDNVNLTIYPQEIVALVGESGSGKSTVARVLAGVYRPTAGQVIFHGEPLEFTRGGLHAYRKRVQMVFQDPYSSLNPVFRASHGIARSLKLHRRELSARQRRREAERIVELVGLTPADEFLRKYPYELSGGQRQRYGFAQALACGPEIILADEPVSMLDVSIRTGVLNLMTDLCRNHGISFLYITHDIASARYVADRLMVMYAGKVVEEGPTEDVLQRPKHPYTQLLLSAVPDPRVDAETTPAVDTTEPPRVIDPGEGCRFRWRCPYRIEVCDRITPELRPLAPGHFAACHVADGGAAGVESA